jgi:uncharacterized membrane-anchored protein YhcB (DUF1043 family)
MLPWYTILIALVIGVVLGYGFRGLISLKLRQVKDKLD